LAWAENAFWQTAAMSASRPPDAKPAAASHDDWLTPGRFAGLLALLTLASFAPVFFGSQTFVFRDFGFFSYPIASYFRESLWRGEIPLWNPFNYCGLPFLAEWNAQVLYPPALFYLIFPLSWSLGVFCLLHLFWGGWGMFFLARAWTQDRYAAAFSGIVFTFNGLMLNSVIWPATISGLGWMPWVVWLTERAWREGGRGIVIAALAGALQMLTGAVEVVLLTWLWLGLFGLVQWIRGRTTRTVLFCRIAIVVLAVSGLCAAQLLPFFDLLAHSHRQGNLNTMQWSMPPTGWLNFLLPLFRCRFDQGVFMQDNQYWTSSYYVGVITVALSLWAAWRVRRGRVWLLSALTLLCLILALGAATPVYNGLSRFIGVLNLMRFPVKFVILPVFALPLLAACGLAGRESVAGGDAACSRRPWFGICIAIAALMLGILWWNGGGAVTEQSRTTVFLNGVARVACFAAMVGGLWLTRKISGVRVQRALQLLLLLLVWLDLFCQAPLPPMVNRTVYASWPADSKPSLGRSRAVVQPSARTRFLYSHLPDPTEDYLSRRAALFMDCNLLDEIPKADGFFPLYLREHAALFADDLPEPMLEFIGASQMLTLQTNTFSWQERTNFMPLLTGGQQPVFTNDDAVLRILSGTNFHPRQTVYLPPAAKTCITAIRSGAVAVSAARFSPQRIEADVKAGNAAMLVIAQMYYHPWRAFVDGRPTRLWRANYGFQALEVPAGAHHVALVYDDRRFHLGAAISLMTLAGCLIFFWLRRRSRAQTADVLAKPAGSE
jgi:hypothetical protein